MHKDSQITNPEPKKESPKMAYQNCLYESHDHDPCQLDVGKGGATVREAPSEDSPAVRKLAWGQGVLVAQPSKSVDSSEWVRLYEYDSRPDQQKRIFAWVRRSELILNSDYRRVTDCWPVAFIVNSGAGFGEGYPDPTIDFTIKGIARGEVPDASHNHYTDEQHVYYADGVFKIRHRLYSNADIFSSAVIDYENRILKIAGFKALKGENEIRWQPEEKLKHCKTIPVVSNETLPINRKLAKTQHDLP